MQMRVGTAVIVFNKGRVLFSLRRNTKNGSGKWCFPGGAVEFGESIEHAAKRELLEETGLKAKKLKFVGYADEPAYGEHWTTLFFKCNSFSGTPKIRKKEKIAELKWCSKKQIPNPLFAATAGALKKKLVWK